MEKEWLGDASVGEAKKISELEGLKYSKWKEEIKG